MSRSEENTGPWRRGRTRSGRPRIPAVAELVERAAELEDRLDDFNGLSKRDLLELEDELLWIGHVLAHVQDIVTLAQREHEYVRLTWSELGAHRGHWHNAARDRWRYVRRRWKGGLAEALRTDPAEARSRRRSSP